MASAVFCSDYETTLMISLSYQLHFIKLSTLHSSFYIRSYLRAVEFEFWSPSGFTRGHQIFVMIIRARWHYGDETKWMHGPKECTWEDVSIFHSECLAEGMQLDQNWNQSKNTKRQNSNCLKMAVNLFSGDSSWRKNENMAFSWMMVV